MIDLLFQIYFVLKNPLVLLKFLSYMSACPRTFLKQKCGMFGGNKKALEEGVKTVKNKRKQNPPQNNNKSKKEKKIIHKPQHPAAKSCPPCDTNMVIPVELLL